MRSPIELRPTNGIVSLKDPEGLPIVRQWLNVKVGDIPEIPKDPNPRAQKTTTSVAKAIKRSASDDKERWFHLMNRGFFIIARKTETLPNGHLRIHLNSNKPGVDYGLGDGGTSYDCLMELLEDPSLVNLVKDKIVPSPSTRTRSSTGKMTPAQ